MLIAVTGPTKAGSRRCAASTVIPGHAFVQNVRRGHCELGVEGRHEGLRVAGAFDELTSSI
jgi:hypothetical protein